MFLQGHIFFRDLHIRCRPYFNAQVTVEIHLPIQRVQGLLTSPLFIVCMSVRI